MSYTHRLRRLGLIIIIVLAALALAPGASSARAESKTMQWLRLDSVIAVQPNGDLRVTETNVVYFSGSPFTFGYRDISLSRVTDVTGIQVTDASGALLYETSTTEDNIRRIKYYFDSALNEQRVITLSYTIIGATRYYPDRDEVFWAGVYADRNGYAVQSALITVSLPEGVVATRASTFGPRASIEGQGTSQVTAVAQEPIPSGWQFEILVQVPHGVLTGFAPTWQADYDRQREYERTAKPFVDLAALLIGLLIAGGSAALGIVVWYRRGRDPQVGMIAEYLTEPPAGISPGAAGTLVDESADMQDIIATLVDLARRGVLVMQETQKQGLIFSSRDWTLARGAQYDTTLAPHERELVRALGLDQASEVALSDFKNTFYKKVPAIQSALYDQIVSAGYYARRPDQARLPYQVAAVACIIAGVASMIALIVLATDVVSTGIAISLGLDFAGVVFFIVARGMPVRTVKGAEARARLVAFKRYLQNIEHYADLKAAADQFDRYLPYAIALGVERGWVQKFAAIDAPAPGWYVPMLVGSHGSTGGGASGGASGASSAPGSIQSASTGITSGLAGMNAGLTAMFSSVATTLSSHPSSSGGGGGGGSSGGGGGGFG